MGRDRHYHDACYGSLDLSCVRCRNKTHRTTDVRNCAAGGASVPAIRGSGTAGKVALTVRATAESEAQDAPSLDRSKVQWR